MKRLTNITTAICFFTGLAWLGTVAPSQAATVTDTFQLKMTGKEWCQGNPKFFENFNIKGANNFTLTVTRDVNGDNDFTDIQATINTNSEDPEIDAITLKGLAFPRNKSGSKAELVLSGVNPGNDDHFLTIRGQAKFDTVGNLTKVTGTFVDQLTGTYTTDKKTGAQSEQVECFDSGTFGTGQKL
ncbi:MAG: hypothetical protein ABIO96_02785 [Nitrospiraceae bacterium]